MTGYPRTTRIHSIPSLSCPAMPTGPITEFIKHHYRHFNAAALVAAAEDYNRHLASGGEMLGTHAGAMATAGRGSSLAGRAREGKVLRIRCSERNTQERNLKPCAPSTCRERR